MRKIDEAAAAASRSSNGYGDNYDDYSQPGGGRNNSRSDECGWEIKARNRPKTNVHFETTVQVENDEAAAAADADAG